MTAAGPGSSPCLSAGVPHGHTHTTHLGMEHGRWLLLERSLLLPPCCTYEQCKEWISGCRWLSQGRQSHCLPVGADTGLRNDFPPVDLLNGEVTKRAILWRACIYSKVPAQIPGPAGRSGLMVSPDSSAGLLTLASSLSGQTLSCFGRRRPGARDMEMPVGEEQAQQSPLLLDHSLPFWVPGLGFCWALASNYLLSWKEIRKSP